MRPSAQSSDCARRSPPRDAQAEAHIADLIRRQPAAPYFLAQAVIVQEHALIALDQKVRELEAELARRPAAAAPAGSAGSGGFLGGLFGGGARPADAPAPQARAGSVPAGGGLWNRGQGLFNLCEHKARLPARGRDEVVRDAILIV